LSVPAATLARGWLGARVPRGPDAEPGPPRRARSGPEEPVCRRLRPARRHPRPARHRRLGPPRLGAAQGASSRVFELPTRRAALVRAVLALPGGGLAVSVGDAGLGALSVGGPRPAGALLARRIVVIDNYDSFTYNAVHLLGSLGARCEVVLNDGVSLEEIERLEPDGILLSPGP